MESYSGLVAIYRKLQSAQNEHQRGHDFEKLINELFSLEKLNPRIRYRPEGEEIDGSFLIDGRTFLLEAKWHRKPLPASSIYQFKGKVDGKLVGTIGVFISMSGFSKEAVEALSHGKVLNILLFDKEDIDYCLMEGHGFRQVLLAKLRAAAEEGVVMLPYSSTLISSVNQSQITKADEIIVLCEGAIDVLILKSLIRRVLPKEDFKYVKFVTSGGSTNLVRLAQLMKSIFASVRLIVVLDADIAGTTIQKELNKALSGMQLTTITATPTVESWIIPENPKVSEKSLLRQAKSRDMLVTEIVDEYVNELNLGQRRTSNKAFGSFLDEMESFFKLG